MNSWPKDRWVALLHEVLTVTARKVYDLLFTEDNSDYDLVKDYILRAYERIPEFYRQQFRGKGAIENKLIRHVEFTSEKE